jgi:hypothetical protein
MEQILCEPVELTEFELDVVAGGNSFSYGTNSGSFAIGAVIGDLNGASSAVSGLFVGQLNLFDINNHPTTSIVNVVDNSINVGGS